MHGLPVGFALTGAKAGEPHTLLAILDQDPDLTHHRDGQMSSVTLDQEVRAG